ncbi:hypothetical protein IWZ00DRAFT_366541 [Phyllosticta capitalensis]|uniref:Uncharacterized protein n=1 Tax=Phyllosticta capitalensis TaxID=121624 RepID=A0ABR1YE96_9PEZI
MINSTLERQRRENTHLVTVLLAVSSTLHQFHNHQGNPAVATKGQMEELARLYNEVDELTTARKIVGRDIRAAIHKKRRAERAPFWAGFSSSIRQVFLLSGNTWIQCAGEFLACLIAIFIICCVGFAALILASLLIYAFLVMVYGLLILPTWQLLKGMHMATDVLSLVRAARRAQGVVLHCFHHIHR